MLYKFGWVQVFSACIYYFSDLEEGTSDPVSRTTAIVNLEGAVDLLISPLLLETLQRFLTLLKFSSYSVFVSKIASWFGVQFSCNKKICFGKEAWFLRNCIYLPMMLEY